MKSGSTCRLSVTGNGPTSCGSTQSMPNIHSRLQTHRRHRPTYACTVTSLSTYTVTLSTFTVSRSTLAVPFSTCTTPFSTVSTRAWETGCESCSWEQVSRWSGAAQSLLCRSRARSHSLHQLITKLMSFSRRQ